MSGDKDIWKCSVRKCGWTGTRDELDYQPDPNSPRFSARMDAVQGAANTAKGFTLNHQPLPMTNHEHSN